jgi:uncharacterized membrane protein YeaQ/YmgE (transglycosylase-associated protein family)
MLLALLLIIVALFIVLPLFGVFLWSLVSIVVAGAIIGGLGRLIVPGRQPIGLLTTVLLGIAGSLIGGGIAHSIHLGGFLAFLLEVGTAALGVAIVSSTRYGRSMINRPHRHMLH